MDCYRDCLGHSDNGRQYHVFDIRLSHEINALERRDPPSKWFARDFDKFIGLSYEASAIACGSHDCDLDGDGVNDLAVGAIIDAGGGT